MPRAALKPCCVAGCKNITSSRYCEQHQNHGDKQRATSYERGYDSRWRKVRLVYLRSNPLCVICSTEGRLTAANVIDHIKPHKGNDALFWDELNWQALCESCHNRKTLTEDMGSWTPKK